MCDMKDLHSPLPVILSGMICMYQNLFICIKNDLYVWDSCDNWNMCIHRFHSSDPHTSLPFILSHMICMYQTWFVCMRLMWRMKDLHPSLPFIWSAYVHPIRHHLYVSDTTHVTTETCASIASIHQIRIQPSHSLYHTWLVRIRHNSYAKPNICIYRSHSFCMYETCLICIRHNSCVTWNTSIHLVHSFCMYVTCLISIRHNKYPT